MNERYSPCRCKGVEIENAAETEIEPIPGNLHISLDVNIKKYAEQAGLPGAGENAKKVSIIVMNPRTGADGHGQF